MNAQLRMPASSAKTSIYPDFEQGRNPASSFLLYKIFGRVRSCGERVIQNLSRYNSANVDFSEEPIPIFKPDLS